MLIDSHCHLDSPAFEKDLDRVVARAHQAGVQGIVTINCAQGVGELRRALELSERLGSSVWATVGIHPHDASIATGEFVEALNSVAEEPAVVAIGETGLDYHYDHSTPVEQHELFRRTIAIARRVRKPLVIHSREAATETLRLLREERAFEVGGVMHCFSEDAAFAKEALSLGFVASFSGMVTFKNAGPVREAARLQPADALLVESDAPYLAPMPHRGRRNEPAYVADTARFLATLRGEDEAEFARRTRENTCRLFGLPLA